MIVADPPLPDTRLPDNRITCGSCRNFVADSIGSGGVGDCLVNGDGKKYQVYESHVIDPWKKKASIKGGIWHGLALWPHAKRICHDHDGVINEKQH